MLPEGSSFCLLPFVMFDMEVAGGVRPCCESRATFGSSRSQTIREAWNAPEWRQLRRDFLSGGRPAGCAYCWELEDRGVPSYRQLNNAWHEDLVPAFDATFVDAESGEMRVPPKLLVLKLSSVCTLACRMCVPSVSTSVRRIWDAELERLTGDARGPVHVNYPDGAALAAELKEIAPSLVQVALSGGEPFAEPRTIEALEALRPWAGSIRLYVNSNLSQLTRGGVDLQELLHGWASTTVCVSVDGPPALQRYTRPGLDLTAFAENVRRLQEDPAVELHSNTALYAVNALHLPETVDYILREIRPAHFDLSISNRPELVHMDARALPASVRTSAMWRIRRFLERLGDYGDVAAQPLTDVRKALDTAVGFLRTAELDAVENLGRMAAYFRKLDAVHGTALEEVSPELARALPAPSPAGGLPRERGGRDER